MSRRLLIGINATNNHVARKIKEWNQINVLLMSMDIFDWIEETLEGGWIWSGFHRKLYFELKEDEIMYRLTWL